MPAVADKVYQERNDTLVGNFESTAKVVPERHTVLGARLGQSEEGIAAIATGVASGASADLSLDDLAADVVLRSVGVERDFGPIQHHEQFGFVGMEPREQAVEGDEAGFAAEDTVKPCPQGGLALRGRMLAMRCSSVKVSSLWTSRSAWTQHRPCWPTLN